MTFTPLQRILAALNHQEADRVPYLIPDNLRPSREMGLSLREFFSKAEYVAEGQLRAREKFGHDALFGFFYAPAEIEAWGGEVVFREDGPPNSGQPFIRNREDLRKLTAPSVHESKRLAEVLKTIRLLKAAGGDEVPVIGVVMSPFSLPVMQAGFEAYLDLLAEDCSELYHLLEVNQQFCLEWANAQLEAGAAVIVYFDPVASPEMVHRKWRQQHAWPIARRMVAGIKGPVITHFASARCLPVLDDLARTGIIGIGVSANEDLSAIKAGCTGKLTIIGNLNGLSMRHWTPSEAERHVKQAIARAGTGGGFILADNHGEIPYQVSDDVLHGIARAVREWGRYPLDWTRTGHDGH